MKRFFYVLLILLAMSSILFYGCESEQPTQTNLNQEETGTIGTLSKKKADNTGGLEDATPSSFLGDLNSKLEGEDSNVRVLLAEWITAAGSKEVGRTVFAADVGNKQLEAHWVPGDPNRGGGRDITWIVDHSEITPTGVLPVDANEAIDRAMNTWQNVNTSNIPLTKLPSQGENFDWGYVQYLTGLGGVPGWYADITHAGWLPGLFFDIIADDPLGHEYILGVTFTFIWIDDNTGLPTDMDNNGKEDVAFREIYYNNWFEWGINTPPFEPIDVEAIVLHEVGHGLSQAHFGKLFGTYANSKLHFAPEAVMNALYIIPQHELFGTDIAGHSSIWASWPNN